MIVRRGAIASAVIVIALFATSSALPARTRLGAAGSAPSELSAKTKKPLTKKQYITQADALCVAASTAFVPVAQQFGSQLRGNSQPSPEVVAAFVKAFASIVQHQIDKTRALVPPKRDQSKLKKMLRLDQDELNQLKADPTLLGGKESPFLGADTRARAYGLQGAAGSKPCTG
jgi:hypothetical protein